MSSYTKFIPFNQPEASRGEATNSGGRAAGEILWDDSPAGASVSLVSDKTPTLRLEFSYGRSSFEAKRHKVVGGVTASVGVNSGRLFVLTIRLPQPAEATEQSLAALAGDLGRLLRLLADESRVAGTRAHYLTACDQLRLGRQLPPLWMTEALTSMRASASR